MAAERAGVSDRSITVGRTNKMKISVSSYSFKKYIMAGGVSYIDICDKAKEMGFYGIEFVDLDFPGFNLTTDPLSSAKEIREHCERIGLPIVAYAVGGNMFAEDIDAEIERLKRCVDVCKELGATVMRHDISYGLPRRPLYNWRRAIDDIVEPIRRVTEYAKEQGIRTCTENHGHLFQAPERVEALIQAVNHENFGWLVDIGNFLCADCRPEIAVPTAAPYAFHVHVKDFIYRSGREPKPAGGYLTTLGGDFIRGTILGNGIVPVRNCMEALKKSGYDGWVSIEFEGAEECLPAIGFGLENLRSILA